MTRSFVVPNESAQTLKDFPPSSDADIRRMAIQAGLALPDALMDELCASYPAFEAMVRRLPRARARFDEPAHHNAGSGRIAALDKAR